MSIPFICLIIMTLILIVFLICSKYYEHRERDRYINLIKVKPIMARELEKYDADIWMDTICSPIIRTIKIYVSGDYDKCFTFTDTREFISFYKKIIETDGKFLIKQYDIIRYKNDVETYNSIFGDK